MRTHTQTGLSLPSNLFFSDNSTHPASLFSNRPSNSTSYDIVSINLLSRTTLQSALMTGRPSVFTSQVSFPLSAADLHEASREMRPPLHRLLVGEWPVILVYPKAIANSSAHFPFRHSILFIFITVVWAFTFHLIVFCTDLRPPQDYLSGSFTSPWLIAGKKNLNVELY